MTKIEREPSKVRIYRSTQGRRHCDGKMLALVAAVLICILLPLAFFTLKYASLLRGYQQERTAIEAAALAVAGDLSRVFIEDPNFGLISLTDVPAIGKNTMAADNFYMPVTGINSLLATVRLDMIIADEFDDPILTMCARRDYDNAIVARDTLVRTLKDNMQQDSTFKDIDGKDVSPFEDAIKAYESNSISIVGGQSRLRSLKIQLGWMPGLRTNTPVPEPADYAHASDDLQTNGFYKACVNVPYKQQPFVFAALSDQPSLVDSAQFQSTQDLPGLIPSIVKCEADQLYVDEGAFGPQRKVVHVVACAEAPASLKARETAGSFIVSLSNSVPIPQISKLSDIFLFKDLSVCPVDLLQTPLRNDCPDSPLTLTKLFVEPRQNPPFSSAVRNALHDWLRRCGPTIDIDSLIEAMNARWENNYPPGSPVAHVYSVDAQGKVKYISRMMPAGAVLPISHKQVRAIAGVPIRVTDDHFDVIIKDFVYQPGRVNGGKHGGEPFPLAFVTNNANMPPSSKQLEENKDTLAFPVGAAGGDVRRFPDPVNTIAVEVQLRSRPKKVSATP